MIVRTLDDLKSTGGYAEKAGHWSSARYLLRDDNVGFTLTQTTVAAGQSIEMHYKNHIEANLLLEGTAELTDHETGTVYQLEPGSMYTLDKHDKHRLHAKTDLRIVCVFTPALTGAETHDEDGSYPML
ncbi:L-ectoine synthase [Chromatiales bacterium (ex Bugula neritina AB1)]|nr:L-ectoine synthase [Chromatiales bacterium (ex Bugula neritina AB1)]